MTDLKNELRSLIVEALRLNQPPESIPENNLTATLGLDSINSLELLILVEDHFKIRINDEDLSVALVDSLDVLSNYITGKLLLPSQDSGEAEVGAII
ncbi:acyl carrier protein [Bradyrhizobium diazoefficiens]|uniref:acyl carrier protein n=1 Tax=Bradyrhizobium diazoefficiens TaxID=1355477 RepID=UPI001B8D7A5D|nr:acyl carrier protein [Bradyrhizobium diazoefficiens]MBR0865889.1 acyl carrier protein [Bradyrhizobium diazoefficiens]MBR0890419.1 acyl carrier protein [Bradyrhizobium diazoefficiens]MBR0922189.1 acyl carrier protein [Bradyrhizobium diazoefficiens]